MVEDEAKIKGETADKTGFGTGATNLPQDGNGVRANMSLQRRSGPRNTRSCSALKDFEIDSDSELVDTDTDLDGDPDYKP